MSNEQTFHRPLRLWPGILAAALLVVLRFAAPRLFQDGAAIGMLGAVGCAAAIVVWWLFFSRAAWPDRLGAVVVIVVATFATRLVIDQSILGGMMGLMLPIYALPITVAPALVVWAVVAGNRRPLARRASMVIAILIGCGVWTLARTDGVQGAGSQLHWRWTPTAEQRLLAKADDEIVALPAAAATPAPPSAPPTARGTTLSTPAADAPKAPPATPMPVAAAVKMPVVWPGFRGPDRDSVIRGLRIATDWNASPPAEEWRRPVGPGWSSFAVAGDFLYTQEQRGNNELVSCYRLSSGRPVWRHADTVRFYESNGGAGPRGTPTLSGGRVFAVGATGLLNALDAATGGVLWSHNVGADAHRQVPMWGFSSSPIVVGDEVIAAASGTLVAYDAATGTLRWVGPSHGGSYSSPQLVTIDGVQQVLLLNGTGATSVAPATGRTLWESSWEGTTIVQPAVLGDHDVLVTTTAATGGEGTRRLSLTHGPGGWKVEERWTSNGLKPYFNDYVVHKGHAYGFDGNILSCIDLEDGKRVWKGGRYGNGQLVVLADQDLLLVMSEEGELALVKATPEQFTEVARFTALNAKTWNHPVVVGRHLLVRNGEEMAAFRLPVAGR